MPQARKRTTKEVGRKDRWLSDYGKREHQDQVEEPAAGRKGIEKSFERGRAG
jgi:hypothetical protein